VEKALFPVIAAAQLEFGDDFLSLPVSCSLSAGFTLRRLWSDIARVSVVDGDKVALQFKSKGSALISLPVIPAPQRDLVLLAFDIKCGATQRDASLDRSLNKSTAAKRRDLVEIWQDGVNRRFSSCSFAPLKVDTAFHDGHLVIRHLIAAKQFTATYLGQQSDAGLFIVKELAVPDAILASGRRARFNLKREVETPLQDQSRSIMRVMDFFHEHERDYIVYEYAPGESLRDIVSQSGPVSEKVALNWCGQIATILSTLHESQPSITHGNLSPDDLIVNNTKISLIDCGAANRYISAVTGGFAGKRAYAAPEFFRGQRAPVNDLYSLGSILFFLITGKDPVPLSQSQAGSNQSVQSLVEQLTQLDPAQRIASAKDALLRIDEATGGPPPNMVQHE
jgi:serine/threonine protein kinase